jgi:hypothetical protein
MRRRWKSDLFAVCAAATHLWRSSASESSTDGKDSSCVDYNAIYWKINQKSRERKCEAMAGCVFEGIGWQGRCQKVSNQSDKRHQPPRPSTSNQIYSLLVKKDSEDVVVAIEGLMKESFTSSVADSIEKSHEVAHEVAKAIVLDVFHDTDNIQHLGTLLGRIFADDSVLSSTRALAYFYLHIDPTMTSLLWQLNWLRFYYCRGGGKVLPLSSSPSDPPLLFSLSVLSLRSIQRLSSSINSSSGLSRKSSVTWSIRLSSRPSNSRIPSSSPWHRSLESPSKSFKRPPPRGWLG